ncbi:MAG: hypothetical protein WCF59_03360 [Desulfobaccales bacterium]
MMQKLTGKALGRPGWLLVLPLVLLLACSAAAAQFSAQMVVRDGEKLALGKIFMQDGKIRQEFDDEEGQTITIVRPDLKKVWVILSREHGFLELPLKTKLPGQFIQIPPDALAKRLVGKETVNGYEAEKYEVTVPGSLGPERQTIWMAIKLGVPIKLVSSDKNFSVEYRYIIEGPQPERLFNLPPGYKKLSAPAG